MFIYDTISSFSTFLAECQGLFYEISQLIDKNNFLAQVIDSDTWINVMNKLLSGLAYLAFIWIKWSLNVLHDSSVVFLDEQSLIGAWRQIIFFVNVFALFMLIAIAMLNALRINIQTYAVKKTLPNLIAGIIFANLSYLLCLAILDFNDVLTSFFLYTAGGPSEIISSIFALILGDNTIENFKVDGIGGVANQVICDYTGIMLTGMGIGYAIRPSADTIGYVLLGLAVATLVFLLLPAFLFMLLSLIMLVRRVVIFILIALAPLGILFFFFPATRGLGEKWLNTYIQWVFMPAVVFFILSIATIFSDADFNITSGLEDQKPFGEIEETGNTLFKILENLNPFAYNNQNHFAILDNHGKIINQNIITDGFLDLSIIDQVHAAPGDDPVPADDDGGDDAGDTTATPADDDGGDDAGDTTATPADDGDNTYSFTFFIDYIIGVALLLASIFVPFSTGNIGTSIMNSIAAFAGGPMAKEGLQRLGGIAGLPGLDKVLPTIAPAVKSGLSRDILGISSSALTGGQKMSPLGLSNQWNFLRTPQALAAYGGPDGVKQEMVRTNQMRREFFDQEMNKQIGKGSNDLIGQLNNLDANGDVQNFLNQRPLKDPSKLNEIGALLKTLDNQAKSNLDPSQYLPARKYIEANAAHTNKFFEGNPEALKMNQYESLHSAIDKVIKDPGARDTLKEEFANTGKITQASTTDISQIMNLAKENYGEQPWKPVTDTGARQLSLDNAHREFSQAIGNQMLNNYKANSGALNNQPLRLIKKQIDAGDFDAAAKIANASDNGGMAAHMKNIRNNSAERSKFAVSLDKMIDNNDLLQNKTPISMKAGDHMADIMGKLEEARQKNNIDDVNKYTAQSSIVGYHQQKIDALKKDPASFNQLQNVIKTKGGSFSSQQDINIKSILEEAPKSVNKEYLQQVMPEIQVSNYDNPYESVANSPDIETLLKTRFNYIARENSAPSTTTVIKETIIPANQPTSPSAKTVINQTFIPSEPTPNPTPNISEPPTPPSFNPTKR